jgi:hypothetical protein
MKKALLTLVCLVIMGGIMAQEEHLSFKGVPINGTLKQYTAAMVKAGFKSEGTQDGLSLLSGDFAGFKGCIVGVSTLTNCDVVNRIAVLFPEKDTWSALMGDYEHLKDLLTEKYGEPDQVSERFTRNVYSDNARIYAVNEGEIEWYAVFSTDLGDIELTLVGGSYSAKARVRLTYWDAKNSSTVRQNALDDL